MSREPQTRFWYGLYNIVLHLGALFCLPYWLFVRFFRGRYQGQFRERVGLLPDDVKARFGGQPAVWVHAASAGETASAAPLVRRLKEAFPGRLFLFTVTSRYGKEMAQRLLDETVDAITFSPLDLPLFVGRFLDVIRPELYVMVETEIWPNMLRLARRRGVKVAMASGHASARSFPRPFWRAVLHEVDLFCMQTEIDKRNMERRGAEGGRVVVTGNMKFDSGETAPAEDALSRLRAEFGAPAGVPVFVAGSTLLEDEGPVLDTIAEIRAQGIDLHAIVAPRRQERVAEVVKGCVQRGLPHGLRSRGESAAVLILDTMGELARTYHLADAAYVGGGLTSDVGLHNILEPAFCGAPVIFGSHHGKAARVAAEFLRRNAGIEIASGGALMPAVKSVLTNQVERTRLVEAGAALLDEHRGAAERQARQIRELVA